MLAKVAEAIPPDLRAAYPRVDRDEIARYCDLSRQCGAAQVAISELMGLAADKAES